MSRDYIEFDCSPVNEPCVSVSQDADYMPAMREEANRMKELLEKRFPDVNGEFMIKKCNHDFGSYLEIRFYYDDDDDGCKELQFVEKHYPTTWDDDQPMKLY